MTREEYRIKVINITQLGMDIHKTAQALFMASEEYISCLQATIEAQEIIIKDKLAIMEAMAQPKTCEGCKHIEIHIYRAHKTATCTNKKCNEMYYCDVGSDFCCNYYEPKAQYE